MKRKKKDNKWQFILMIGIFILVISFGLYSSFTETNDLNNNSEKTTGIITQIERRWSRGYFIKYDYFVNTRKYKATQKLTIKKESIKLNDKFEVIYSSINPKNSQLLFEKRITE